MKSVAVIYINYNCSDLINFSIDLLKKNLFFSGIIEIIVIDHSNNFSNNHEHDHIKVYSRPNLGFSAGINHAASMTKADYFLICNPDIEIKEKFTLDNYISKYDFFGFHVYPHDYNFSGKLPNLFGLFYEFLKTMYSLVGLIKIKDTPFIFKKINIPPDGLVCDEVPGCFFVISREKFDILNGYDESFFLYFEDTDFFYRARKEGFTILCFDDQAIVHKREENTKKFSKHILKIYLKSLLNITIKYITKY
jgi:GT2 family glycosyltransferase